MRKADFDAVFGYAKLSGAGEKILEDVFRAARRKSGQTAGKIPEQMGREKGPRALAIVVELQFGKDFAYGEEIAVPSRKIVLGIFAGASDYGVRHCIGDDAQRGIDVSRSQGFCHPGKGNARREAGKFGDGAIVNGERGAVSAQAAHGQQMPQDCCAQGSVIASLCRGVQGRIDLEVAEGGGEQIFLPVR